MLRRFVPLMLCVVFAYLVLVSRLYEVSVEEHSVWAREAVTLERSAHRVPHRRGRILDRQGRVWVQDQLRYEIEFVWRDFRRGHPLGNIAQLMSLTLMRPVDLAEVAGGDAALWADHLVSLSPSEIRAFGRGEALRVGSVEVAALAEKGRRDLRREERRPARAEALRFYVERLLQVDRKEYRALRDLWDTDRAAESYAQLVAGLRLGAGESAGAAGMRVRRELRERVDRSLLHLEELGRLVDWSELDGQGLNLNGSPLDSSPLGMVVRVLDTAREESENQAADRLFRTAAGFSASHLDLDNLRLLDLEWLKKCLYWDGPRLEAWLEERGGGYAEQVQRYVAGYVFARMQLAGGSQEERVLDALAHEFVLPKDRPDPRQELVLPWRQAQRLRVLDALPEMLQEEAPEGWVDVAVLPIQDAAHWDGLVRDGSLLEGDLLDAMLSYDDDRFGGRLERERVVADLLELPGTGVRRTDWRKGELAPIEAVLLAWDARLQARVSDVLQQLAQPVRFGSEAVQQALEDRDHVIKDMSSRPMRFTESPSDELVRHLERYHLDYAGLEVKSVRSRSLEALVPSEDPEGEPQLLAKHWIGKVRSPKLVSLLGRMAQEFQAKEVWRQVKLDEEDRDYIKQVAASSYLPSQTVGGSGMEGYFDRELRGRNGIREVVGLQEARDGGHALFLPPTDGRDLRLTLDMDLQQAAEYVINHPAAPPPTEKKFDPEWLAKPVGGLVLMTTDGQVLAAASAPGEPDEPAPHQDGQRALAIERTMRMPTFQPPGSVLKPLVAAWALEHLGLNPDRPQVLCHETTHNKSKPGAGWGKIGCHSSHGHSTNANAAGDILDIKLSYAIRVSCNTYFSWLGEQLYDEQEFPKMLAAFGLGKRTGVLQFGLEGRSGWLEDYAYETKLEYTQVQRQRLGNGLSHVMATPMQMARAYAGLATGELPQVRVVSHIGGEAVAPAAQTLPISEFNLKIIRDAMAEVVTQSGGSAFGKGLSPEDIGYQFVCKTGSADYITTGQKPDYKHWNPDTTPEPTWIKGVRKHTWVVGWLPAEDPQVVCVVYVHDTATTSSHGAVYVMAQFLQEPAVQAYLAEMK